MWKQIKEKILEFILKSIWPTVIIIATSISFGSYFSSNYFINLIINKEYLTLSIVSTITIIIGISAISLCYFFINVLKRKIEKYYYRKEKYLSYYKLNRNLKKETIKSKISCKEFFSIGNGNNDNILINYKKYESTIELDLVNISDGSFLEIIFNPILKEDYIKKHIEDEKLKELNHFSVRENIGKYVEHYIKFKEELDFIIFSMSDDDLQGEDSVFNLRNTIFKNRIKDELFKKTIDTYRIINEKNHIKFNFEENYIDENSEIIINFYFRNKKIDQKTIKLGELLKNEQVNIEFSEEILKNI